MRNAEPVAYRFKSVNKASGDYLARNTLRWLEHGIVKLRDAEKPFVVDGLLLRLVSLALGEQKQ